MTLSVLTFIGNLFSYFFQGLLGIIEGASNYVISVFGNDIESIIGSLANDISGYGVMAVPVLVLVLGLLGLGIYLILDFARFAEDLT